MQILIFYDGFDFEGAYLLSGIIGFIYPAYLSFKALESESTADDKLLLTYWTVYGFITLFDPVISVVFSFIPMYQFIKVINFTFLLFLCLI
jgi:receptor expression-enhancing protein 5/6